MARQGSYTRRINLYINGMQVRNDIKSINARMIHLRSTIRTLEVGSREYNRQMRQIRHLDGIIRRHNESLKITRLNLTSLKGLANAFNKYWPMVMGSIGAFAGLAMGARRSAQMFAEMEDQMADVMKVTGLTRKEVGELYEELRKMDTRTAQESLMELAWVAGKLGIEAVDDILGFVNAADKITVALAKDLGGSAEEAVRQIGKMTEIFEVRDVYGVEESMLRVASAINELGMASTAQESTLINFAYRVGGIAPNAEVSIQNILGLGAALDILGQKTEVSATAYSRVMTTLARDTEIMATIAGMTIVEFRELFERDANEAMLVVLEAVGSAEGGFQALIQALGSAGLEGQRLTQVLGALSRNTDLIRQQQELANRAFGEGDSVINEFNIKNYNAQAILEKKQKKLANLRRELGERLLPVYMGALDVQKRYMTGVVSLVEWIWEHRRTLVTLILTILTYNIVLRGSIALQNTAIVAGKSLMVAVHALRIAYFRLTGQMFAMKRAMVRIKMLGLKNPYIAAAAAVAALGVAIYRLTRKQAVFSKETEKMWINLTKTQQKQIADQTASLEHLFNRLRQTNKETANRRRVVQEINEVYPELLKNIDAERASLEALEKAYDNYIENVRRRIEEETRLQKVIENNQRIAEINAKLAQGVSKSKQRELVDERMQLQWQNTLIKEQLAFSNLVDLYGEDIAAFKKEIQDLEDVLNKFDSGNFVRNIKQLSDGSEAIEHGVFFGDEFISKDNERRITEITTRIRELNKEILTREHGEEYARLKMELLDIQKVLNDFDEEKTVRLTIHTDEFSGIKDGVFFGDEFISTDNEERIYELQSRVQELIDLIEALRAAGEKPIQIQLQDFSPEAETVAKYALKQQLLAGELLGGWEEYQKKRAEIELRYARGRLEQTQKESEHYLRRRGDVLNKEIEMFREQQAIIEKQREAALIHDPLKKEEEDYQKRLREHGLFHDNKLKLTEDMTPEELAAYEALLEEHRQNISNIHAEMIADEIQQRQDAHDLVMLELEYAHFKELEAATDLEAAKQVLRRYMNQEEIDAIRTHERAKAILKDIHAQQEQEKNREHLRQLLSDLTAIFESDNLESIITANGVFSEEEKAIILSRIKEIREALAEIQDDDDDDPKTYRRFRGLRSDVFGFNPDDWVNLGNYISVTYDGVESLSDAFGKLGQAIKDAVDKEEGFGKGLPGLHMGLMAISHAWSDINRIMANIAEERMRDLQEAHDKDIESLTERYQMGLISEEYYNAERKRLEDNFDRERAKHALTQAKREQRIATFQAIVNTAAAIVKALPNFALAGLVAAAGALQIGIIRSTPLPRIPGAETGGQIDVVRSQDGKQFRADYRPDKRGWVNKPTVITGESGKEYVIPHEGVQNPALQPFIHSIEQARQNGSLASMTIPGREKGGHVSETYHISREHAQNSQVKSVLNIIKSAKEKESYVEHSVFQNELHFIRINDQQPWGEGHPSQYVRKVLQSKIKAAASGPGRASAADLFFDFQRANKTIEFVISEKHPSFPLASGLMETIKTYQQKQTAPRIEVVPGMDAGGFIRVLRQQDGKEFRAAYNPDLRGWISKPTVITGESDSEYILPGEATANPTIRPIIDMIEMARISNTLPTLNIEAAYPAILSGRQQGGYVNTSTAATGQQQQPATPDYSDEIRRLHELLEKNSQAIDELNNNIKHPLTAIVSLTGRNGFYEKDRHFRQLKQNVYL